MSTLIPRGHSAVMAQRREPPDSLDFFCTPPWATRALIAHVLPAINTELYGTVWEPACGEGHMAQVLSDIAAETDSFRVTATDIFDYGYGEAGVDFLSADLSYLTDFIITNPPFKVALDFTLRALDRARHGVAMLVRTQWIEGKDRYERLFRDHPPTVFAPFVERVPMVKGRWDPQASTATSYSWFVWAQPNPDRFRTFLIPPCRQALTKPDDVRRFTSPVASEAML